MLAVFEAIDPLMSGTFQALQSYKIEDIVFGGDFANCLKASSAHHAFEVDLKRFHDIVEL